MINKLLPFIFFLTFSAYAVLIAEDPSTDQEPHFQQVYPQKMYDSIPGCENFDYDVRLTNLRNARNATNVRELPMWENSEMGGVFDDASKVDPEEFNTQWGNGGASSDAVSSEQLGVTCTNCLISGNPWDFIYNDSINHDTFEFQTYIGGKNVTVQEPQMIAFEGLDDYALAFVEEPNLGTVNGEMRLFIPFAQADDGSVLANQISVNGNNVEVPRYVQSSNNYYYKTDISSASSEYQESEPGICIIFYPVSGNTPHDITPQSSQMTMVGDTMSSYRNKNVNFQNEEMATHCPMADWGYEGYFYSYRKDCLENMIPTLNRGCRCIGGYDQIVCYNNAQVMVMECSGKADGEMPDSYKDEYEPMLCEGRTFKIGDVEVDCCKPGENGYAGQDIGYACSYAAKNPDFESTTIMNWSTGHSFSFTQEK